MLLAAEDRTSGVGRVEAEKLAAARIAAREASGPKWYIVQCGRRTDRQVIDTFERFKLETYYPTVTEFKPLPRRRLSQAQRRSGLAVMEPRDVAVFPRYIFTRIDRQESNWREAFDYAGVGGMMGHSGMLIWMPDDAIKRVRDRVGHQLHTSDTMRAFLAIGDEVFVNYGPFATFPGIVEEGLDIPIEKLDASTRIKVAVNIFGRATPVELEYWQVSKRSD